MGISATAAAEYQLALSETTKEDQQEASAETCWWFTLTGSAGGVPSLNVAADVAALLCSVEIDDAGACERGLHLCKAKVSCTRTQIGLCVCEANGGS